MNYETESQLCFDQDACKPKNKKIIFVLHLFYFQNRYLKGRHRGASEYSVRKLEAQIKQHVQVEVTHKDLQVPSKKPNAINGYIEVKKPIAYISNIQEYVSFYLDSLERWIFKNTIVWCYKIKMGKEMDYNIFKTHIQ